MYDVPSTCWTHGTLAKREKEKHTIQISDSLSLWMLPPRHTTAGMDFIWIKLTINSRYVSHSIFICFWLDTYNSFTIIPMFTVECGGHYFSFWFFFSFQLANWFVFRLFICTKWVMLWCVYLASKSKLQLSECRRTDWTASSEKSGRWFRVTFVSHLIRRQEVL